MSRFFPDEQTLDRDFSELTVSPFNFIENAFVLFAGTHLSPCEYVKDHMFPQHFCQTVKRKGLLNHDMLTYASCGGSEECFSFAPFLFSYSLLKVKIIILVLLSHLSFY